MDDQAIDQAAEKPSKVNCYSEGEGAFMEWSQELRGRLLNPLLSRMAKCGIRAGHLTLISLIVGLAFCPVFLAGFHGWAFTVLFLHVLLDGLDGPLARYRNEASTKGSFTDSMADQTVVTVTTIAMIQAGYAGIWSGSLYISCYLFVVVFAMVRNALTIPYSWLFRPRFLVFIWFAVEVYLWPNTLNYVLWGATALLALKTLTGFVNIRRKI